jgi:hypothetical protein
MRDEDSENISQKGMESQAWQLTNQTGSGKRMVSRDRNHRERNRDVLTRKTGKTSMRHRDLIFPTPSPAFFLQICSREQRPKQLHPQVNLKQG